MSASYRAVRRGADQMSGRARIVEAAAALHAATKAVTAGDRSD
ncbi:hypothetical protein ACWD1W_28945 [Streptomyces olivaceoviridis]